MKELYKVREITISLLDRTTHEPFLDIPCEFGVIIEKEGILFFETHIFNNEDFSKFNYANLGCPACAKMYSFDDIEIEVPFMAFIKMTSKENTVFFRCFDYITIHEEDVLYSYKKSEDPEMKPSQLLRVDLWGLDSDTETRVVDETVRRLRRKLRQAQSRVTINTVWGYGYQLGEVL